MTDLIIYNRSLVAQGIIDLTTSILWERRFYEAGYFEIHVPMNDNSIALLQKDNFIMRSDSAETGIIIYVRKRSDGKSKDEITVIGRFLSYLMHGHIIKQDTTLSGNVETIMRSLVTSTNLQVSGLTLGELCGTTKTVEYAVKYADLHDTLCELAKLSGVGFRIRLDPNSGVMYFECYEPTNHSAEQTTNPAVIFSPDYDTAYGGAEYVEDDTKTVNAVVVRYSGEYGEVVVDYNPQSVTGIDKHQIAIEITSPVTTTDESNEKVLDREATEEKLLEEAKKKIKKKVKKLSVPVADSGSFTYKTDFDIGDIVTLQYAPFGVNMTRRIHKISENYTQNEVQIIPDMGEPYPTNEEDT